MNVQCGLDHIITVIHAKETSEHVNDAGMHSVIIINQRVKELWIGLQFENKKKTYRSIFNLNHI